MADKEQRPLGGTQKPRNQSDVAREASEKLAAARPKKVKVIAVNDGYDNLKLWKAGEQFTVHLKEDEAIPEWVVTQEEWDRRRQDMIDADPDLNEGDPGQIAALEEELARALWREKDEAAMARAKAAFEAQRRKDGLVGAGKQ